MPLSCPGFRFGAVHAGIKSGRTLDLGLIVPDAPAVGSAVFTSNDVKAAPVRVSRAALVRARGEVLAVVVNSGNANACTGTEGMADARAMVAATARAVGAPRKNVLVASTGVIGQRLPMARVERGIGAAAAELGRRFEPFAESILTTDRAAKTARKRVGGTRLIGCTKGAGMIAPNMATTLTFVCTDAKISRAALDRATRRATEQTFNAITIDGDTSTNDMLLVLASGASGTPVGVKAFEAALTDLLGDLARQLMRGGEGVHHVVTVHVGGAKSTAAATSAARSIANSPLVKTAIAGQDPNWGRFLSAAGNAGIGLRPERVDIWLDNVRIVRDGQAAPGRAVEARAARVMRRPEYTIRLDLSAGAAEGRYLACDLSHEYVSINADYRT